MDKDCITIDDYIHNGNKAYHEAMKIATRIQFDKVFGMDKDNLNNEAEEMSEKYIQNYLKNSNLYPLCNNNRRMCLITVDLHGMQKAYEDGFKAAMELFEQREKTK